MPVVDVYLYVRIAASFAGVAPIAQACSPRCQYKIDQWRCSEFDIRLTAAGFS
jgi:hypothetical protein